MITRKYIMSNYKSVEIRGIRFGSEARSFITAGTTEVHLFELC